MNTNPSSGLNRRPRQFRCRFLGLGMGLLLTAAAAVRGAADVRRFGARGDGEQDESLAFEQAAAAGSGEVQVPAGRYRIAELEIPENTQIRGTGPGSVLLVPANAAFALRLDSGAAVVDVSFALAPALAWRRTGAADTGTAPADAACILIRDSRQTSVRRCTFRDLPRIGVYAQASRDLRIRDCTFAATAAAIVLEGVSAADIRGNTIVDTTAAAIQFRTAPEDVGTAANLVVIGNRVARTAGSGIRLQGGRRLLLQGNILENTAEYALELHDCRDAAVLGNAIFDGRGAVRIGDSCNGISVTGNTIRATEKAASRWIGIHVGNAVTAAADINAAAAANEPVAVNITGNTIIVTAAAPRTGIRLERGRAVVCTANVLENAELRDQAGILPAPPAARPPARPPLPAAARIEVQTLNLEWRFRADPEARGVEEEWFAPGLDDSDWERLNPEPAAGTAEPPAAEAEAATTAAAAPDVQDAADETVAEDTDPTREVPAPGAEVETAADTGNAAATRQPAAATAVTWFRCRLPGMPIPYPFVYLYLTDVPSQAVPYLNGSLLTDAHRPARGVVLDLTGRVVADTVSVLSLWLPAEQLRQALRGPVRILFSDTALPLEQVPQLQQQHGNLPTAATKAADSRPALED